MADYRSFCGWCGNETGFGSHKPGCEWVQKQRAAEKEQRDFEIALHKEYRDKTDDELVEEAAQLYDSMQALGSMLHGMEKKWDFMRRRLQNQKLLDKLRDRLGKRYI